MNCLEIRWLTALGAVGLALACSAGEDSRTSDLKAAGGSGSGGSPGSGNGGVGSGGEGAGGAAAGGTDAGGAGTGGSGTGATDTGGNGMGGAIDVSSLGMNDVTILLPLPEDVAEPVVALGSESAGDGSPFVPRTLFDRLGEGGSAGILSPETYERLHLVAVRFDLCDHNEPGPCVSPGGQSKEGSLRLVFQPIRENLAAEDVGFHAFYSIPEAEIPDALHDLVELGNLRSGPDEPLTISAPLSEGNAEYREKLRAFVSAHGGETNLVRLSMNAQPVIFASVTWLFREVERQGTTFEDMTIEGTSETTQQVTLAGEGFFQVSPVSDAPQGLALALDLLAFENASEEERTMALEALVAIDNPLTSAPDNVACVGCHTSSVALAMRSADMGVDSQTLSGRFTTSFDVSIDAGESATTDRTLRALGYVGTTPLISQRVAHDTALLLEDLSRLTK